MRAMSFMLTTDQIRDKTKTVTRRLGWKTPIEAIHAAINQIREKLNPKPRLKIATGTRKTCAKN